MTQGALLYQSSRSPNVQAQYDYLYCYTNVQSSVCRVGFSTFTFHFQLVLMTENIYLYDAEKSTLRLNKVGIGNVLYLQWPESEPRYNYLHCLASSSGKHQIRSIKAFISLNTNIF